VKEAVAEDADLSTDNPMFETLHQPGVGTFPVPGAPMTFSASARKPAAKAPVLGAHTEEILGDVVGMDDTEISRLFDTGIVQSPNFAVSRHVA
jgi:2-methylfumaryl-CoA isomerase